MKTTPGMKQFCIIWMQYCLKKNMYWFLLLLLLVVVVVVVVVVGRGSFMILGSFQVFQVSRLESAHYLGPTTPAGP